MIKKPKMFHLLCRYFDDDTDKEFPKSKIDKHSDWYKIEYDKDGNEVYFERSNGNWVIWEYDADGDVIYEENNYHGVIINNRK